MGQAPAEINSFLDGCRSAVESELSRWLPEDDGPARTVHRAMRYAVFGGGKRLRPALLIAACEALGGRVEDALAPAAAIEMIHTYSLVHDDLPAMDDDDLRRGRPTVHRQFDEATAVLAGDALLTRAFEVLATRPAGDAHAGRRAAAVALAARAAGVDGMVGGQIADLEAERADPGIEHVEWIHSRKTGALFGACTELGALYAGADEGLRGAFARFGRELGLAFQVADDLLDLNATAAQIGKTPGKDRRSGKATYPRSVGADAARLSAEQRVKEASARLRRAGCDDERLSALAWYAVDRKR